MASPPSAAHSVLVQTDQVLAARGALVHRVKGGDRGNFGVGQIQLRGAEIDPGLGDVALLGLHQVQQRQQRRAGDRITGDEFGRLGPGQVGEDVSGVKELRDADAPVLRWSSVPTSRISRGLIPCA